MNIEEGISKHFNKRLQIKDNSVYEGENYYAQIHEYMDDETWQKEYRVRKEFDSDKSYREARFSTKGQIKMEEVRDYNKMSTTFYKDGEKNLEFVRIEDKSIYDSRSVLDQDRDLGLNYAECVSAWDEAGNKYIYVKDVMVGEIVKSTFSLKKQEAGKQYDGIYEGEDITIDSLDGIENIGNFKEYLDFEEVVEKTDKGVVIHRSYEENGVEFKDNIGLDENNQRTFHDNTVQKRDNFSYFKKTYGKDKVTKASYIEWDRNATEYDRQRSLKYAEIVEDKYEENLRLDSVVDSVTGIANIYDLKMSKRESLSNLAKEDSLIGEKVNGEFGPLVNIIQTTDDKTILEYLRGDVEELNERFNSEALGEKYTELKKVIEEKQAEAAELDMKREQALEKLEAIKQEEKNKDNPNIGDI